MSVAAQLEAHLRERVRRNLDRTNVVLVGLITAPLNRISGQLAAGVVVDAWSENGDSYTSTARSLAPYSLFVDSGTGVYGPLGGRIYPRTAKALTFFWTARGAVYSFRSVRGQPPQRYFHEPMAANYANALQTAWAP